MDETKRDGAATAAEPKPTFTKEQLLGIELPIKTIEPPGYTGSLEIRCLTALEQSRVRASMLDVNYQGGQTIVKGKLEGSDPLICSLGVTKPQMSQGDWGKLPNDLVTFAANEIRELSGMNITVDQAEGN